MHAVAVVVVMESVFEEAMKWWGSVGKHGDAFEKMYILVCVQFESRS